MTLAIDARPAARSSDGVVHLRLAVNGTAMSELVLTDAAQTYTWQIPASLWVDGTTRSPSPCHASCARLTAVAATLANWDWPSAACAFAARGGSRVPGLGAREAACQQKRRTRQEGSPTCRVKCDAW